MSTENEIVINWPNSIRHEELYWVYPIGMLVFGLLSLTLVVNVLLSIFAIPLGFKGIGIVGFAPMLLSPVLLFFGILCLRHVISCFSRKQHLLRFENTKVIYKPAHIDYTLLLDKQGQRELANQCLGLGRGFKKLEFPLSFVKVLAINRSERTITIKLGMFEILINGFASICEFERAVVIIQDMTRNNQ